MKNWFIILFAAFTVLLAPAQGAILNKKPTPTRQHKQEQKDTTFSDLAQWADLSPEQRAIAKWIDENKRVDLSEYRIAQIVKAAYAQAQKLRIEPMLLIALMKHESGFNPNAVSAHGAKGLTQVMPKYHRDKLAGRSPLNIQTSVEVGAAVYREYLDQANGNTWRALQTYNGGYYNRRNEYPKAVLANKKKIERYVVENLFSEPPIAQYYLVASQ